MGHIVAIVSQKGGVGKTSTTVNLGACISAIKREVLLIGLDPQGGLAKCFGLVSSDAQPGLFNVLKDGVSPSDVIYRSHPRLPRLDIMPVNVRSSSQEADFYNMLMAGNRVLDRVVNRIRNHYDFIFVDCPSRLDAPTQAALAVADADPVPIQCEYASMAAVGNVLRTALEVKQMSNPQLAIFGFLLTMADKRARFTIKVIQEVRNHLKEHVFRTIIPRDPYVAEVPIRQQPVIAFTMETPGAKVYIQLAREVLQRGNFSEGPGT